MAHPSARAHASGVLINLAAIRGNHSHCREHQSIDVVLGGVDDV
jgi:hypothetical protein